MDRAVYNWESKNQNQIKHFNHKWHGQSNEPIKTRSNHVWREARENVCKRVTISFGFTSDWMKKWREFISQSCGVFDTKPKQITFDTQVKKLQHTFRSCYISFYYISQILRALWLVNLAGRTLLYGPLKFRVRFIAKLFRDISPSVLNYYSM